jgi:hypothetical protein
MRTDRGPTLYFSTQGYNAPGRLDNLVGTLVAALPDATVIVARIIPAASSGTLSRIQVYNNAITKLMARRALRGEKVTIVDMPSGVQTKDLTDGLHPTDQGYQNMAIKWSIAITAADSIGWIKDPVSGEIPGQLPRDYCAHDPVWLAQDEIASGGGLGANVWLRGTCFVKYVSSPLPELRGLIVIARYRKPAIVASSTRRRR